MKKSKIFGVITLLFILLIGLTGCGKNIDGDQLKEKQERFEKLVLVANQINEEIEAEVKEGLIIVDGKPAVGKDNSSVTKLNELLDEYSKQKITIPESKEYTVKELDELNSNLEKSIKTLDSDLLTALQLDTIEIKELEKTVLDKEAFDKAFSDQSNIVNKYNGLKTQVNTINEAVKAETKRVNDAKKKEEAKKLAAKKKQCEKDYGWWENGKCVYGGMGKPVLYLYPTKKTQIKVSFENPSLLTTTYPKFNGLWEVTAYPNGDLYDKNNKYYYALYWEEDLIRKIDFKTGFYVEGKDAIKFLEEKLTIIGLNDRERNEFIMYWLPILEKNEKNLVYFELTKEKQEDNKLIINPKPDSLLRMTIHVKKVDKKTNIKEQELETFKRTGFSAIEWGGINY